MNYTSFCETLKQSLIPELAPDTVISLQKIRKNNGIIQDAYCIHTPGSTCSPIVYLDSLYENFQNGANVSDLCDIILTCLDQDPPFSTDIFQKIRDFNSAKDRIAFRLISKEQNKSLLSDIPWVPYLDLALIFYLYLDSSRTGQTTALIHNEQMEAWNKSVDDLYLLSLVNTPRLFPPVLQPLESLLFDELEGFDPSSSETLPDCSSPISPLYVLTNRSGIHGASCLLYHDIIKDFADRLQSDIIILPSSIHEVILIPDNNIYNYKEIRDMVQKVNSEDVPAEDRLSDQLYLFSRNHKHLTVWPSGDSPNKPEPI